MNALVPDLSVPIRAALLANTTIAAMLPNYFSSKTIFTRRPAPVDAAYPMILVSPNIAKTDRDGINDSRPLIRRDVTVYGSNEAADNYRAVELLADLIYATFHHIRDAIDIDDDDWELVDINCTGPIPAPADDDSHIARAVSLTILLANPQ